MSNCKTIAICNQKGGVMGYKMIAFIPIPTTPNGILTNTETLDPMKAQEKPAA